MNEQERGEMFISWLATRVAPERFASLYAALEDIEAWCRDKGLQNNSLFEADDSDAVAAVRHSYENRYLMPFLHRKNIADADEALDYYEEFLEEPPASSPNPQAEENGAQKAAQADPAATDGAADSAACMPAEAPGQEDSAGIVEQLDAPAPAAAVSETPAADDERNTVGKPGAQQPRWDIYESVILLEGYLDLLEGATQKQQVVSRVSADLRRMAFNRGVCIDSVYRNEIGVASEMQRMESAYKGYTKGLAATKLFTETVGLYRNDREKYLEILEKAENMVSPSLLPAGFYAERLQVVVNRANSLPEVTREYRAVPFMRAHAATHAYVHIDRCVSLCASKTTVSELPELLENQEPGGSASEMLDAVSEFLEWIWHLDVSAIVQELSEKCSESLKERQKEVLTLRSRGKTLKEIGKEFGFTRERCRQIESKACKTICEKLKLQIQELFMLVYALRDGDVILPLGKIKETIGESEFLDLLWFVVKKEPSRFDFCEYSAEFDAVVIRTPETPALDKLKCLKPLLDELPDVIEESEKEPLLQEFAGKHSVPVKLLGDALKAAYKKDGRFYHRGNLTVTFMCEYVLKHRFPSGYKTDNEYEASRCLEYMAELFGDAAPKKSTGRALDAVMGRVGVLCGRGKYIHPDLLQVDQSVVERVCDFIVRARRGVLPYREIYEKLKAKDVFEGSQITDMYLLQGAVMKYRKELLKRCPEANTTRTTIKKDVNLKFDDELESFIEERGTVYKSEIFEEFKSLYDASLGQVIGRCENILSIGGGYYIHASSLDIDPADYDELRLFLARLCEEAPANIRAVFDAAYQQFPDFMERNDIQDRDKLFAVFRYMFANEFSFSKPYIARQGAEDVTNRSAILQLIADYDSIELEELVGICEERGIHHVSIRNLQRLIAPDYLRVNELELQRRENAGVTDEVIEQTVNLVNEMLDADGYVVASKVNNFIWFPQIGVEWNEFLLESVIVQSEKISVIFSLSDPHRHANAIYVSEKYKDDNLKSFLLKIVTEKVRGGAFNTKGEMQKWLSEEGLIEKKLPKYFAGAEYFYVDKTGVHCTEDQGDS